MLYQYIQKYVKILGGFVNYDKISTKFNHPLTLQVAGLVHEAVRILERDKLNERKKLSTGSKPGRGPEAGAEKNEQEQKQHQEQKQEKEQNRINCKNRSIALIIQGIVGSLKHNCNACELGHSDSGSNL